MIKLRFHSMQQSFWIGKGGFTFTVKAKINNVTFISIMKIRSVENINGSKEKQIAIYAEQQLKL